MSKTPTLKLYNTLTRAVEVFSPINDSSVGLYACGLTVYDYTHLGHLRKYTFDDVLVRTLRQLGFNVKFVQNITDVGHLSSDADEGEDKLEKGAKKYNQTVWDVAHQFEEYFFYSMDLIGNARPDISCRATDHITQQLNMVLQLEKKGYTYVIDGDGVYFDTSKLSDYGKMAHLQLDKLKEGARLEINEGKRNPTDFALWKFERPGENRAMVWPSPWHERSFPGWHIECSAMSIEYLGEQFDIHTGGIDHIPVHHTNEIAQAEAASGKKPFVRYWVHHNFLRVDGEKMSKSLGNFFTIDDVLERGFSPMALRLLIMGSHYRSEMNFTWDALAGAQKAWEKLISAYGKLVSATTKNSQLSKLSSQAQNSYDAFMAAMLEDLNTSSALAVVWEVIKSKEISDVEKLQLLNQFDLFLGFDFEGEWVLFSQQASQNDQAKKQADSELPAELTTLLDERQLARNEKRWGDADTLRAKIESLGYSLVDEIDGSQTVKAAK